MRVLDKHAAGRRFHAANHPRRIPQQHDVALVALHREVLIHGSDDNAFRLSNHRVQRVVRDGATTGNSCEPAAPSCPQFPVHSIPMQICAVAPAPRGDAFRKHFENRVVGFEGKMAVGIGPPHQVKQFDFAALFGRARRYDLLRQYIQWRLRDDKPI